ncbi:MAG: hypothetical protein B6I38_00475 [Anaerolineaceae bacterium 4572_5.1]|nr:MAG: hypothetical protein B6I38_00475 [Anaerolineaceae bacterium 4572_5.1]
MQMLPIWNMRFLKPIPQLIWFSNGRQWNMQRLTKFRYLTLQERRFSKQIGIARMKFAQAIFAK